MKKVVLMGVPHHNNLGDNAIAYAEKKFIKDYLPEYDYYEISEETIDKCVYKVIDYIDKDSLIFLHGGGNFGDEYLYVEEGRRKVIELFPENTIILFPQTMFFSETKQGKEELEKSKKIYSKHKKLILGIFLIFVFSYFLIWTVSQPFNKCPDEGMKWKICKYIAKHGSIPQGGNEEIREPDWGISYAFQPILTYMIGGVFVKIASFFTNDKFALVVAARLVSTISMTVSVYFVVKIAQKLLKGIYKYLFIVIIVFQPITAFLASYINNDSTAVLATTMIIYLWILGLESNWKTKHCILLGLSIGFCSLTYYNAYGYILCSVILCLVSVISNKMKIKEILQKVLIVALMAFAVAGWWFIRNAIIYDGDILGMKTQVECGDKYAIDKYKPSKRETPQKNNESVMDMLIKDDWIKTTLKSFVGIFGYQNIIMSSRIYQFYLILWGLGIIG